MEDDFCGSGTQSAPFGVGVTHTTAPVITTTSSSWSSGGELNFSTCNSMMTMRKEWPNPQYPNHFHPSFPPRETCTQVISPSTCTSHQSSNAQQTGMKDLSPSSSPSSSSPIDNYRQSHWFPTSESAHCVVPTRNQSSDSCSPSQLREIIEMLLMCYMEFGGTVRSEEFRNLVEVFLHPVFESLQTFKDANKNEREEKSKSTFVDSESPSSSSSSSVASTFTQFPSVPSTCCSSSHAGWYSTKATVNDTEPPMGMMLEQEQECDSLSCPVCYGVLIDPVTIPCGHSFCKKCLQRENIGQTCRRCKHVLTSLDVSQSKTNVLVGSLVEKWWKNEVTATQLRNEGNSLFEEKKVEQALQKYSEALNLAPEDHLSLGNRSHALLTAGKSEEALEDAEAATRSSPFWPKGYFRKSAALISLGRYEDAFLSLTVCMYLMKLVSCTAPLPGTKEAPAQTQVFNEMIKILQKLFLHSTNAVGSTIKRHNVGEQLQFTPYPSGRRATGLSGRYERPRPKGIAPGCIRAFEWNDFECSSSGDESDFSRNLLNSRVYSSSAPVNSSLTNMWNWKPPRSQLQYQMNTGHHVLNLPSTTKQTNFPTSSVVEQLSVRMSRLFSRASQDLKSFESRLKVLRSKTTLRNVDSTLISVNDMECSLCYRLLFQPVSTGCGHTFCRSCLDRCLDHNPCCPLCKTSLQNYLASREHAITEFLDAALRQYFSKELEERRKQHMEELYSAVPTEGRNSLNADIPIFVCTMAFPTVPCPLHVFEPRYRLMIRRCMENGSNRFGMCCYLADNEGNYGDIGTLLEIKNIQFFPDGRSVVDTVGCRRFKIIRKTVVDGYNAARIELLHDRSVEDTEIPVVNDLHDRVLREATEWLQSIGQVRRQRIHSHFGPMPQPEENWLSSPDGPSWTWWLLAILPLDSKAQLSILSMSSLQKRLECLLKVLHFVKIRMGGAGE